MAEDKERFRRALDFMKVLGVSHVVVAPLLRRLVKLYDNEWGLIEEENYRVLADSYFDQEETKETKAPMRVTRNSSRRAASNEIRESEAPIKGAPSVDTKANKRVTFSPVSSTFENEIPKHIEDEGKETQVENNCSKSSVPQQEKVHSRPYELQVECVRYRETLPDDLGHMQRGVFKKPRIEVAPLPPIVNKLAPETLGLPPPKIPLKVKEEPLDFSLAMEREEIVRKHIAPQPYLPAAIMSTRQQEKQIVLYNKDNESRSRSDDCESKGSLIRKIPALITYTEKGAKQTNESLLKIADTYGDASDNESGGTLQNGNVQRSKKSRYMNMCTNDKGKGSTSNRSLILRSKEMQGLGLGSSATVKEEPAGASALHHDTYYHSWDDISRGQEAVPISLSNELTKENLPSSFHYIKCNITFQDAYVNFALARIGEEDCCAKCSSDCLKRYPPCHCAGESGGEFAYDSRGCLRQVLLNEAIADRQSSSTARNKFCEKGSCLLVQGKNGENSEQCKGHLIRKFVKECWSKCGCDMRCGNRVVQKGICRKLQVFYVSKGKGWGLRTLEDLPLGAFICEYVGEILTNVELHERNISRKGHTSHYPALLDADLSSETMLKDEELLCLDATNYGNVARFINHRCYDANMVDIPVEIESPDHHYYHIAFFTTRAVKALEELTWDYCIDFEDVMHPIKAFRCLCGSQQCRGRHYRA